MVHETTPPYSSQLNGKAAKKNITLIGLIDTIMLNLSASSHWGNSKRNVSYY